MHQLLLLRHAKSEPGDPTRPDHARALNACGRAAAATLRQAMRELGLVPDIILVSPARRTRETLAALEPWDETPLVEVQEPLYLAPAGRVLAALRSVAETARSVLVIGHNPGLHELAMFLANQQAARHDEAAARRLTEGFPTTALAEFAVPGPWGMLDEGGARLLRLLRPQDLTPRP